MDNAPFRLERKRLAYLFTCAAIAICAVSATRSAAAGAASGQPVPGTVAAEDGGSAGERAAPFDQGRRGGSDAERDAQRQDRPASKEDGSSHPEPSWQVPAPGCPYQNRPLNLIV